MKVPTETYFLGFDLYTQMINMLENRWIALSIFCVITISNAVFWVTFAPISNLTQDYVGRGPFDNVSSINMLANVSLILFLPGTILGSLLRKRYGMKNALLICGTMTAVGGYLRLIPTLCTNQLSSSGIYLFLLLGQILAATAQPFFCNIPPGVAAIWFSSSERELATTVGSMATPVGNALGQALSSLLVRKDSKGNIRGMALLLGIEAIFCTLTCIVVHLFFQSAPSEPPSAAARQLLQVWHYRHHK
jgi:FLVCR family MFS transporter 7